MAQVKFKIVGTAPLKMHKDTLVNPMHPLSKKMKELTSKSKKTDEDREKIALLEWQAGMYYDNEIGPYIPGEALLAMIRSGAKRQRKGKDVQSGCAIVGEKIPLEYEGPRDIEQLRGDTRFIDQCTVVVQRARVLRTRPRFNEWSVNFTVKFDEDLLNKEDVIHFVKMAGDYSGLLDQRPQFGTFEVAEAN